MQIIKDTNYLQELRANICVSDNMLKNKILLIIEELVENVFQHTKSYQIDLDISISSDETVINICHQLENDNFSILSHDSGDVIGSSNVNGRGVFLIKNYCKDIKEKYECNKKYYILKI